MEFGYILISEVGFDDSLPCDSRSAHQTREPLSRSGFRMSLRRGATVVATALLLTFAPGRAVAASSGQTGYLKGTNVSCASELTRRDFKHLATNDPLKLAKLIHSGRLRPAQLTFAAESMGSAADIELIISTLKPLLEDVSAVVREGAIYGLSVKALSPEVRERLADIAEKDPNPGVRLAAAEALED